MKREDVLRELTQARAHVAGAIRSCNEMKEQDQKNAVAYRIAASDLGKAIEEIVKTQSALQQLESSGTDIERLELSVRTCNMLKRAGIETVEQLISKSRNELVRVRGMGTRSFNEILEKLEDRELSLRRY